MKKIKKYFFHYLLIKYIMKIHTFIVVALSVTTMTLLSFGSVVAMWNGGQWSGQWMHQWQWQWNGQGQGQMDKNTGENQESHGWNPADLLEGVPLQTLSEAEKEMLYYGYSEELLAHDMYMYFYELYAVQTFQNIANSELEHMTAVKTLLERYNLEIPTDYRVLTDTFDELKTQGEESLQKALEVGVKIELLDIEDIAETIRTTDNDDFKIMFTNIGGASFNHLRWFLKALDNNGLETQLDYSAYLSEDDLATKWGSLKSKMAEMLEAEGEVLPVQASSATIKENCDTEQSENNTWNANWKGNQSQSTGNIQNKNNENSYNATLQAEYKNTYEAKYWDIISSMDDEKLLTLITKIDELITLVQTEDYTFIVKQKYNAMLYALREIAVESRDISYSIDTISQ